MSYGQPRLRIDMTSDQVSDFVDKLATDDDFRQRLTDDPVAVLAEYGIEASSEFIPALVELPPKEEIESLIAQALESEFMTIHAGPAVLFPIFSAVFPWIGLGASTES